MINKKFFPTDRIENISWNNSLSNLDLEIATLIILTGLYENKTITRDKLKGQLSSLRKGDLLKHKNTYHCDINNKWYSYEPFSEVLQDLSIYVKGVSYMKLIEVLQLYTNKNYNYCINVITKSIIKPLLDTFSNYNSDNFSRFFSTNILSFPKIQNQGRYSECYCCGNSHYEYNSYETKQQMNLIINFFHLYKKGNLTKIPKY